MNNNNPRSNSPAKREQTPKAEKLSVPYRPARELLYTE